MPKKSTPYSKTGYFSKLICDYLAENESMHSFYHRFPKIENFKLQLEEKKDRYSMDSRRILVERLKIQYEGLETSEATTLNIEALLEPNTFTITTGHQLNLFTGPLYFLYKIFSVINLVEKLNKKYEDHQFVPVYWMATEDHDLDEINYFNLFREKIIWDKEAGGAVGELSNDGLEGVLNTFKARLGDTENAKKLGGLFEDAYTKHSNLAEATRYLGNQLFSEYGLVIIDGNDPILKKAFIPYAQKELKENLSFRKISDTTARIVARGYKAQVNPREINLFYLNKGIRERIIEQEGSYLVNGTKRIFTSDEINAELLEYPERFSPNALLRPLYQEVILPNLCYIGGGGELAYWFQLIDYFKEIKIPFPILLLRNSALLVSEKKLAKLEKLNTEIESLFLKTSELSDRLTHQLSEIKIDFSSQRDHLHRQFMDMYEIAEKTDASFLGAVAAQEKKQINGLNNLERRLLKAQKRKIKDQLERLVKIQDSLFPNKSLQERSMNFSEFYLTYGNGLFLELKENLDPLDTNFSIITM